MAVTNSGGTSPSGAEPSEAARAGAGPAPKRSAEGALQRTSLLSTVGLVSGVLGVTALIFGIALYAIDPDVVGLALLNIGFAVVALAFYGTTHWRSLSRVAAGRSTAFVVLEGAIAAGVVGLTGTANYFADKSMIEWDLTRDELFTLHGQSIRVAENLEEDVSIVGFYRPTDAGRAALQNLVELYQKHTRRISLEFVNPDSAPPSVLKRYQMTAKSPRIAVLGAKERTAKIKQATEELLTNALVKVAEKPPRRVYVLTGHGEPSIEDEKSELGYAKSATDLRDEGYEVEALSMVDKDRVPADASCVVVAGPESPLFPNEVDALDAWIARGGRVLILLEPGVEAGLDRVFRTYGVEVQDNLVVDPNPASRAFGFGADAPIVQKLETHAITDPLRGSALLFFTTRGVAPRFGVEKAKVATLVQTSPGSWGETEYRAGAKIERDENDAPGPVPIAVAVTMSTMTAIDRSSDQARLVVFGDSSFPNNRFSGMSGNGDLFVNAVNWLVGDEDKISIRPKARGASRIPLTEMQQYGIMFFSVNLLPLLIIGFGFSVWAVRRRK